MALSGLAARVGRSMQTPALGRMAAGSPALFALGGFGAAVAQAHPLEGARDFAMDAVLGTPDVRGSEWDNMILGYDIAPSHFLNKAFGLNIPTIDAPAGITAARLYLNKTVRDNLTAANKNQTAANNAREWAQSDYDRGYTRSWTTAQQYPSIRYRDEGVYAPGEMVFGMYNGRR